MSADKWTTFIAHKFQTVISLEIDEFSRISFMFDHQEENNVLCILTYIELQRNFLFHWWNTVWIQMCKGVNKISPQKWVLYRQVELLPIQSKRGDKFYLFFLIVNIAGGFVQIIAVIRAEIQIDTNLAVVR